MTTEHIDPNLFYSFEIGDEGLREVRYIINHVKTLSSEQKFLSIPYYY